MAKRKKKNGEAGKTDEIYTIRVLNPPPPSGSAIVRLRRAPAAGPGAQPAIAGGAARLRAANPGPTPSTPAIRSLARRLARGG